MWDDSDRFCNSQTVNLQVVFTFRDFRLGKDSYSFVQLLDVRIVIVIVSMNFLIIKTLVTN
jgi:hypothetical protein